ncbi:EH domain-containing protein 1-like 1 [Homarus americanus]|uniref:EH domain-containing protein 1-like 1 n=1 Tax=Homarus americanus TaxID=6706 RepID=A0A8J5JGI9_HOMAM|nr:EH domain-containing protein 1-like 1 [Homarus americanus]
MFVLFRYVEEHVQRTGVAIETQGFSFVTSGRKRESLTGNATLHLYPHFKALQEIDGVVDYLNTEISTSKQKKFSLVTFIDTPGLVDGDMKYPFDVNQSMLWLGDLCDLIFVFFDPIGQALCKRTLNIVEKLNETHSDRIRFYLSKADEAGHESDRQRVMMQIVQELCKRPGLNKTGFEMPTIYIPNPNKPTRCVNQVEEVCKDIEKTINQTIQNTLNQLERDCEQISHLVDEAVEADNRARSYNFRAKMKGMGLSLFGFFLPVALLLQLLVSTAPRDLLNNLVGSDMAEAISSFMSPTTAFWETIDDENQLVVLTIVLVISGVCLLVSRYINQPLPTLQRRSKKALAEKREFVNSHVKAQKQKLYSEYLQQSVSEHDL